MTNRLIRSGLSFVAASLLALPLAGLSSADAASFRDISDSSAKTQIEALYQKGLIKGVTSSEFQPNQQLTAAQGISLIVQSFNLNLDAVRFIKAPKASDYFAKVKDSDWSAQAFVIAQIFDFDVPSDIDPGAALTKEQFTYYLVKGMERSSGLPLINIKPVELKDDAKITAVYQGAIQRSFHYGIQSPGADNSFHPQDPVTRAEAAVMVYNALEYLKSHPAP
ncbi:S-layer homology domain-containing protein [Paenibacillus sp. JX-17]|uniref:S-layer homology domain-containing protein n=1 Tax=Paenibacillus lacisoli TaxID=3064525 RepID=A0ABT9CEB9_9BACL|nr:S-layer homology domain-containing protein [Paenibacillus sp. JX-17]MDO7905953.1 S-layer homology domain-containing protein [Paenibacillus sp. JX-17]